jgi:hypothetical protein
MPIHRFAIGLTIALALGAGTARADERVECAQAYEQTQRLQQKSELIAALDAAERCARATCPAILHQDCARWAPEIKAKLASVSLRVRGKDACAQDDATISITGEHRSVDEHKHESVLAPGSHEIRVTDRISGMTKTETIDFAEGERRELDFDFAPPGAKCGEAPPSPSTTRTIPTASLVIGGIGGVLLLAGGTVGIIGAVKRGDLDCKGHCEPDRVDAVQSFFTAGDILGAVGLVAVGTAAAIYFLSPSSTTPAATLARPLAISF